MHFRGLILSAMLCAGGPGEANLFLISGIGSQACEVWLEDSRNEAEGGVWILGFWSGLNKENASFVGASLSGNGIIAEVRKECAAKPKSILIEAIGRAFYRLKAQGL